MQAWKQRFVTEADLVTSWDTWFTYAWCVNMVLVILTGGQFQA